MELIDLLEIWDPYKEKDKPYSKLKIPNNIIDIINDSISQPNCIIDARDYRTLVLSRNDKEPRINLYLEMSNNAIFEVTFSTIWVSVNEKIFNFISESNLMPKIPYNLFRYVRRKDKKIIEGYLFKHINLKE